LGWFGSGDRRKVAVVVTSDGRRVHIPIEPTPSPITVIAPDATAAPEAERVPVRPAA